MQVYIRKDLKEALKLGQDIRYPDRNSYDGELGETVSIKVDPSVLTSSQREELIRCNFYPSRKDTILKDKKYTELIPLKVGEANLNVLKILLDDRIVKRGLIN